MRGRGGVGSKDGAPADALRAVRHLTLGEGQLATTALEPVDHVAAGAVLHNDLHRAPAVVVPMQEDVLKTYDAWVLQPLQARGLLERLVGVVDGRAADPLEHVRPTAAYHQRSLAEPATAERVAHAVNAGARAARARLCLLRSLPEEAAETEAADKEGATTDV